MLLLSLTVSHISYVLVWLLLSASHYKQYNNKLPQHTISGFTGIHIIPQQCLLLYLLSFLLYLLLLYLLFNVLIITILIITILRFTILISYILIITSFTVLITIFASQYRTVNDGPPRPDGRWSPLMPK